MTSQRNLRLLWLSFVLFWMTSDSNCLPVEQQEAISSTTEIPRVNNPVYNVWEYAYIHDGPINTRATSH
ncbi:hypothetical protein SK128_001268, partial [Halocaridina rubra]